MAAPHNIKRYIAREEDLAARHEDLKKASITGTQASWFEAQALSKGNPREIERQTKAMAEDLMLAAAQLTKVRRERLRELYHAEMTQYQKELAAKGLTIEVKIN